MANEIERRETIRIKAAVFRIGHLMEGDNTTPSVSWGVVPFNQDSGRNPAAGILRAGRNLLDLLDAER